MSARFRASVTLPSQAEAPNCGAQRRREISTRLHDDLRQPQPVRQSTQLPRQMRRGVGGRRRLGVRGRDQETAVPAVGFQIHPSDHGVTEQERQAVVAELSLRCRHVVGLNDIAIGIEHTGYSDRQVLSDKDQMHSSLKLTKWLRCRYDIRIKNVIGHNESLSSPFHHERVKSLKHQTHGDFKRKSMNKYRKRLRAAGRC